MEHISIKLKSKNRINKKIKLKRLQVSCDLKFQKVQSSNIFQRMQRF